MNYKLSITMIVKNEEANLQRCLDSFLPIINMKDDDTLEPQTELIIVDTGSIDRTINVAKKYTDKVFVKEFVPWSFSDARNYAISKATGEKILIVDADDELTRESVYPLMDYVLNPAYDQYPSFFIIIHNIYNSRGESTVFRQVRLVKNDGDFRYEGAIHNKPKIKTPYFYCRNVAFNHYGYHWDKNKKLVDDKYNRSLPMLLEAYKENPTDTHVLTHICKTYRIRDEWPKVIEYGEKWLKEMKIIQANGQYHEGWFSYLEVFVNLIDAYLQLGDIKNAMRIYDESKRFSDRLPDVDLLIGFYYVDRDNEKAAEYLEKCLEKIKTPGSPYEELLTTNIRMSVPKIYNFLARHYFNIGHKLRAGQMLNEGIYSNDHKVPLRWDVFNWSKSA